MSTGYRICLLESEHIAAVKACDCATDDDALLDADAVLQASTFPTVELWNGPRRVGILSRPITH
jgi:hypothetical protein